MLLGALFYGLSLKEPQPTQASNLTMPDSAKSAKTTPSVPAAFNSASPDSSTGHGPTDQTDLVTGASGTSGQPAPRQAAGDQETATRSTPGRRDSSLPEPVQAAAAPSGNEPAHSQAPPIGLRLAPDVRLPVAAMPLNFKVSPVAKKAIDQIVKDYYRDVAASLPPIDPRGNANATTADLIEDSETGELTRIVTNGPAVQAARNFADYRFKTLFGNDAYNRMTMNTLLEARMPVNPQE